MQTLPLLAGATPLYAQGKPPIVIGWLSGNQRSFMLDGFIDGMAALGWKLGTHSVMEERHADGHIDRLPALAQELAARKPALVSVRM